VLGVELVDVLLLGDAAFSDVVLSELLVPFDAPLLPPDLADE